jgi:formylglycine-generating enzyme required for sulfatase activity
MNRILSFLAIFSLCLLASSCKSSVKVPENPDYKMSYTVKGATFEMSKVRPGFFSMGMSGDSRRKITGGYVHEVALDGFVISGPVSRGLWSAVMGGNAEKPDEPVDMVSWTDIQKFISKLNRATGKIFMLPSEAQWEYASRQPDLKSIFNVVSEWCLDSYLDPVEEVQGKDENTMGVLMVNPVPAAEGNEKVIRTVLERNPLNSHTRRTKLGFRLVQPTEEKIDDGILNLLTGSTVERETVDASDAAAETFNVEGVKFDMVKVSGGKFRMGFTEYDMPYDGFKVYDDEKNDHDVTLDDFEIGRTEVTIALWKAVMGSLPYLNDPEDASAPVGNVSWYDCQNFIIKLNEMTGRTFRLPTEAEWEYAARGGYRSNHYGFSGSNDMNLVMWNAENSDGRKHDVATKKANELGIYDMSGNVWEWCYDRQGDYPKDPQVNPAGPSEGIYRVMRGGSYSSRWEACRIANRQFIPPVNVKGSFGLRLAI